MHILLNRKNQKTLHSSQTNARWVTRRAGDVVGPALIEKAAIPATNAKDPESPVASTGVHSRFLVANIAVGVACLALSRLRSDDSARRWKLRA